MKVTFCGHRDAPSDIIESLRSTVRHLIENRQADTFYVGEQGSFDRMVLSVLREMEAEFDIRYFVVHAYYPKENTEGIFPEGLEKVPRRFAILKRNEWMIEHSDAAVTYVISPAGGAAKFRERALKMGKEVTELAKYAHSLTKSPFYRNLPLK